MRRFIGGAQLGYNFQLGYAGEFIAGLEADLQGLVSGRGNHNLAAAYRNILVNRDGLLNSADGGAALDFLGTVRARVGYLMNPTLLVYGTGGLAFGGVGYSLSTTSLYTNAAGVRAQNAIGNLDALDHAARLDRWRRRRMDVHAALEPQGRISLL